MLFPLACVEEEPLVENPRSTAGGRGDYRFEPEEGGSELCFDVQSKLIECGVGSLVASRSASCQNIDSPASDPCQSACLLEASCKELGNLLCDRITTLELEECSASCQAAQTHICELVLPPSWVCDGEADCVDSSDEQICPEDFVCNDGGEILAVYACDGFPDCLEGEDEDDCGDGFMCEDGSTIVSRWLCNDYPDCAGGEDESVEQCSFACGDGTLVPLGFECDGFEDCADGSDEHDDCEPFRCEFQLGPEFFCSGNAECLDSSDEPEGCVSSVAFTCGGGELIPIEWQCDDEADCPDASDEDGCASPTLFTCENGAELASTSECDRYVDCPDGSDEHDGCWYRVCE